MYERFTDRARKVMQLANQEAQRFNHEYIGTEHILLGLVKEGTGVAANVLKNLDIDLRKIRIPVYMLSTREVVLLAGARFMVTPEIAVGGDTGLTMVSLYGDGTKLDPPGTLNRVPLNLSGEYQMASGLYAGANLFIANLLLKEEGEDTLMGVMAHVGYAIGM